MRNPNSTYACPEYAGRNRALERELWTPSWEALEAHRRPCKACSPLAYCDAARPLLDQYEVDCDAARAVTAGSLQDRREVIRGVTPALRGRVEARAAEWWPGIKEKLLK